MNLYKEIYQILKGNISEYIARMVVSLLQGMFLFSLCRIYILEKFGNATEQKLFSNGRYGLMFIVCMFIILFVSYFWNYEAKNPSQIRKIKTFSFLIKLVVAIFLAFFLVKTINLFRNYW
jgi:hypothetical protein